MSQNHVLVEPGVVAKVILNRPEARNAMSDLTLCEIADIFRGLSKDPNVRAVVVTGRGKDFCAGADIEWMRAGGRMPVEQGKKDARLLAQMLDAVDHCPVPVIVAAHGNVFGGGLGLLAACDIAVLSEEARLSFSECRLGIMPAVISCWVLPKIGVANARRYYLTAEVFGADQARLIGLVHETVPAAGLQSRADELAQGVLKCGPGAVRAAKKVISQIAVAPATERVDFALQALMALRSSAEGQEGLSAFLEKRPPKWAAQS